MAEVIRRRFAGGVGAGEVQAPAAAAAAHAAGQAGAVCHMGAHALGAAGYAVRAIGLALPDRPAAVADEIRWQLDHLSAEVRAALRALPPVGENASGPLGPGLLASGHLGTIIRALQAGLTQTDWEEHKTQDPRPPEAISEAIDADEHLAAAPPCPCLTAEALSGFVEVGPGLVGVAIVGGVADAGFRVVGQDETRGGVQGGADGGELDEDGRAVAPSSTMHHAADGGELALSASEAARDRVGVRVRPHAAGVY
jgi:hypothetical protein